MNEAMFDLIVIGGGAAGFYGAIQVSDKKPGQRIMILEKTPKLLSKVKVSGGGRCNVTYNCHEPIALSHHYPRGEKQLKQIFKRYHMSDTVKWFESKGVKLNAEHDGRMFPETSDSQTIIDCFLNEAKRLNIHVEINTQVIHIYDRIGSLEVVCQNEKRFHAKKILVAIGGHPNPQAYSWIADVGHQVKTPIPSLFTFNDSQKEFKDLMGIAVTKGEVKIAGTKFSQEGPILITHWGLSGPGVIKLSAWAAEHLYQMNYKFTVLVSWIGSIKEEEFRDQLTEQRKIRSKQKVITNPLFGLPQRLWQRLCELAAVEEQRIWSELPQRNMNKLMELIIRCPFQICGKTTFKEEFVTCGGVDLKEINLETMESKKVKNLYFAGEVLDIDGETGGFNFQAAWSTASIAAVAIANSQP